MRRMLDEQEVINLIEEHGGGGGTEYTAGNGINIAENAISVDTEVIATKEDVADVQPGLTTYGVEIDDLTGKTVQDLLDAGVPSLCYYTDNHDYIRNKIVWQNGDEFYLKGVFIVWDDHGAENPPVVFVTKKTVAGSYKFKVSTANARYFILQNAKAKLSAVQTADTTPAKIYEVSQVSGIQDLILASRYQDAANDYIYGVVPKISGAFQDDINYGNQLKAPTSDGNYQLEASVANGVPTFAWNPTSGSGSKYLHKVKIYANVISQQYIWTEDIITSSATAYTSASDYLTDRGYTITAASDQPTKSLTTYSGTNITAIAYRESQGYYTSTLSINSANVVSYSGWAVTDRAPSITDEVITL